MNNQRYANFKLDANTKNWNVTPEGWLDCRASLTKTGIFVYQDAGGVSRELRTEAEVFAPESMDTAKLLPLTVRHPDVVVDGENYRDYLVGVAGDTPERNGIYLDNNIRVMDKALVEDILEHRQRGESVELSMGYTCDLLDQSGSVSEGAYDKVQTNIRYNHVSIVDRGRAGRDVRLRLDKQTGRELQMDTRKIVVSPVDIDGFHMDGFEIEVTLDAADGVQRILSKLGDAVKLVAGQTTKLDAKGQELSALQAKLDEAAETGKGLQTKLDEWENPNSGKVQTLVSDRVALETLAAGLKIDTKDKTNQDLQLEVIKSVHKDFNPEGKDATYITARFDAVVEGLTKAVADKGSGKLAGVRADAINLGGGSEPVNHRDAFMAKSQAAYKPQEAAATN